MTSEKTHVVLIAVNLHDFCRPIRIALLFGVNQLVGWITRQTKPHFLRLFVGYAIAVGTAAYLLKIVTTVLIHLESHFRYDAMRWNEIFEIFG